MIHLTEGKTLFLNNVVETGMKKAAESLSFFINEQVEISNVNYQIEPVDNDQFLQKEEELCLLYSQVHGFSDGFCFLAFGKSEVEKICQISLPPEVINDAQKYQEMQEAIMLEVDNIITASVVTEFANMLNDRMLAYIPNLEWLKTAGANGFIKEKVKDFDHTLRIKARYATMNASVNPEMIWVFKQDFLRIVADYK